MIVWTLRGEAMAHGSRDNWPVLEIDMYIALVLIFDMGIHFVVFVMVSEFVCVWVLRCLQCECIIAAVIVPDGHIPFGKLGDNADLRAVPWVRAVK